jgi:rubredoxin
VIDEQVTDDSESHSMGKYECSPCDYVFWDDFRTSPARTWEEVTWVARRVYMGREEGVERFGEIFKDAPLSHAHRLRI